MSGEPNWMAVAIVVAVAIVGLVGWIIWRKGQPFAQGDVFRASRLARHNHLFPIQVLITPNSVVQHIPRWIGKQEETVHMAHIASVKVNTHLMLSDVVIETSGGSDSIRCHGHHKGDAIRMKALIEQYQTAYYRAGQLQTHPQAPIPAPPQT